MRKCFYTILVFWISILIVLPELKAQAPANDSCQNAIPVLFNEIVEFSTILATSEGPAHPDDCQSSGVAPDSIGADIWYTYTALDSGTVIWNICNTADFDTKIAVYVPGATCNPTNEDLLACNEDATDAFGNACSNATSAVIFDAVKDSTYLLRLGGWISEDSASAGTGTFIIETYVEPDRPDNDDCADAIAVALGANQVVNNTNATTDGPIHPDDQVCFGFGDNTAQSDIWYTFTSTITGTVEWSTCGTVNWDSRLVVYGPNIDCATASPDNMIGCSDATSGCPGFTNIVFFDVQQDSTYLLRVGGYNGASGLGTFDLLEANPPEPPGNDICADADSAYLATPEEADFFDVVFEGTTIAATGSQDVLDPLCGTGQGGDFPDVWYKFNTLGNTEIEVRFSTTTEGAEFYGELYEFCDGTIDVAVDTFCFLYDNTNTGVLLDTITNLPPENKEYYFRVSSWIFEPPGNFLLQFVADIVSDAEEVTFPGETKVFPNPAKDQITLQLNLTEKAFINMRIHNSLGAEMTNQQLGELGSGSHSKQLSTTNWPPGVYFISLQTTNSSQVMRFIKS